MFNWKKRGLIFSPDSRYSWMFSHAQCPFPLDFGDFIRIYFATREAYQNGMCRAFGGFVDVEKDNLQNIIRVSDKALMDLGGIGEFDEFGSMPISVVYHNGEYYLYYVGWTRSFSVPYDWEIGFAKSKDGERFEKVGKGPLIGPTVHEPYLNSTPVVYKFANDNWHMFYHTGVQWLKGGDKLESQYIIKHATSTDGIEWQRNNTPIIPLKVENECQTTPALMQLEGKYHMFFCYRHGLDFRHVTNKSYRIGYACSEDLVHWTRDDSKVGIDVSSSGWDSKMIEYPHISKINGKYCMFYCGNHFGRDGFGYAELDV
ncbi:hypothetical protein [uncultured Pseudodesulfovibrio sp.]|uniref:hypothetical protein n=1 Tax=uncultured Pseudodesulfovibrio sp. TaxID=2035858 RepID=UPI0029C7B6BF|nr:hypothetical protein [uncultured Pseudodesulfovibrio sp.]